MLGIIVFLLCVAFIVGGLMLLRNSANGPLPPPDKTKQGKTTDCNDKIADDDNEHRN